MNDLDAKHPAQIFRLFPPPVPRACRDGIRMGAYVTLVCLRVFDENDCRWSKDIEDSPSSLVYVSHLTSAAAFHTRKTPMLAAWPRPSHAALRASCRVCLPALSGRTLSQLALGPLCPAWSCVKPPLLLCQSLDISHGVYRCPYQGFTCRCRSHASHGLCAWEDVRDLPLAVP